MESHGDMIALVINYEYDNFFTMEQLYFPSLPHMGSQSPRTEA